MSRKRSLGYVKENDVRYGLKVAHRDPKSSKVISLQCRFCIAFGREEKVGSKCKAATTVQGWSHPFRYDNIENHLCNQHSGQWALYQALESSSERASFFNDVPVAFKNSIKAHFLSSSLGAERQIVYDIEKDIVDTIVGNMMFNPEDHDDSDADHDADEEPAFGSATKINALHLRHRQAVAKAKERALSLFKRVESEDDVAIYFYSVTIPKMKTTLFCLAMRYVSCGTSFRMASKLIDCTYDVLGNPSLHACSRDEISNFVRAVCAVNLQRIIDLLRRSWAFSLALNSATHQSTSFLDLRFRVFIPNYHSIVNLHGCTLLMFDRHIGDIMSTMVNKFLTVLCPDWTICLLVLTSDGACNMTGWVAGVVTHLDAAMHSDYLVMEDIMNNQNLIAKMQTTCPRVVNRWLLTKKVINWFKIHRPQLLAHIKSKQPDSAPPHLWWVALLFMHHFTTRATVTFCSIQGLTTLVLQQRNALDNLIASFIDNVGVTGPLTAKSIANIDPSTHVISGQFLVGLASWADTLLNEANESDQNALQHDIALVYVTACDHIHEISAYQDRNNNAMADPSSIPPVLPHELVELSAADFIRKIQQHAFRLDHCYSSTQIDLIANEHKALIHAHRCEPVLKDDIDLLSSNSSFKDESDFSILCWEKDLFRKRLLNFGLEGVM
ncbi:hypothetical protein CY35_06G113300 [Sphagnum magellanicum]|nr:hypothetical protein CY35_06G113300 [Sphagnum magellanicum]